MLFDYAQLYTVGKRSYKSELDRINRDLESAGLPRLKAEPAAHGGLQLSTENRPVATAALPSALPPTAHSGSSSA
jgi:hypothetical protein